jgi:hypothetical protein
MWYFYTSRTLTETLIVTHYCLASYLRGLGAKILHFNKNKTPLHCHVTLSFPSQSTVCKSTIFQSEGNSFASLSYMDRNARVLGSNILFRALLSGIRFSLCFTKLWQEIYVANAPHRYKTAGKITVLNITIFTSLDSKHEDRRCRTSHNKHSLASVCPSPLHDYYFNVPLLYPRTLSLPNL